MKGDLFGVRSFPGPKHQIHHLLLHCSSCLTGVSGCFCRTAPKLWSQFVSWGSQGSRGETRPFLFFGRIGWNHARLCFLSLRLFHLKYSIDKKLKYLQTSAIVLVVSITLSSSSLPHNCLPHWLEGANLFHADFYLLLCSVLLWLSTETTSAKIQSGRRQRGEISTYLSSLHHISRFNPHIFISVIFSCK